jgi:hypothetical protein
MLAQVPVAYSQMITGTWKGKIDRQKVELKIIQKGDSLTGTSYYYESAIKYRRYSIRGFFDASTNEAVWWDDRLIEEKPARSSLAAGKTPLLARADFNCPGSGKMMLDGKAGKAGETDPKGIVDLDKIEFGSFSDEWDFVIDNYTAGGNDPQLIDSIELISRMAVTQEQVLVKQETPAFTTPVQKTIIAVVPVIKEETTITPAPKIVRQTIEEKLLTRKKVFTTEIPVMGDSIELRFYDNAEIDGDSISLFLNEQLIFQHIRLLGTAYTIKLAAAALNETNELIMVAENLGTIPPNTSYMVAIVGDKRYEARLESTEGSSAMIRLIKKNASP